MYGVMQHLCRGSHCKVYQSAHYRCKFVNNTKDASADCVPMFRVILMDCSRMGEPKILLGRYAPNLPTLSPLSPPHLPRQCFIQLPLQTIILDRTLIQIKWICPAMLLKMTGWRQSLEQQLRNNILMNPLAISYLWPSCLPVVVQVWKSQSEPVAT